MQHVLDRRIGLGELTPVNLVEPEALFGRPMLILPAALHALAAGEAAMLTVPEMNRYAGSRRGGDKPYRMTEDGTAIISILGPLANRSYGWSYEFIQYQLAMAASDPQCLCVLLDIESPGGQAAGAFETAAAVRALGQQKPVTAVVNGMAASAAYAIASAASKIVMTPSGLAGSIGVVMLHADYSRMLDKAGITPTMIFAGARKVDTYPYHPLSDAAKASLQAEVDQLYDQFINTVAMGRKNLSAAAIRATEAGVFIGDEAVKAGLADELGTFETALASMMPRSGGIGRGARMAEDRPDPNAAAATEDNSTMENTAMDKFTQTDIDDAVATAVANATGKASTDAVAAERARTAAILGLEEAKGREKLAQQLAVTDGMTVEAAKAILAAAPKTSDLEARAGGFTGLPGGGGTAGAAPDKQAEIDKQYATLAADLGRRHGLPARS